MPRRARQVPGGLVYHVLNRAVGRMKLFTRDRDYEAFERVLAPGVCAIADANLELLPDAKPLARCTVAQSGR
jgi:hypothetical protein